jgi:hypothetical protein
MLYEIRTYTAAANRADQLKERFRVHTLPFFVRHGIEVIGCWEPVDQPDRLVYMVRFQDEEARKAAWNNFSADPDWKLIKQKSEVEGPLMDTQSTVVLSPAEFSPILR